jgi:hypothetical protein
MKKEIGILQSNAFFPESNKKSHQNNKTIIVPLDTKKLRGRY